LPIAGSGEEFLTEKFYKQHRNTESERDDKNTFRGFISIGIDKNREKNGVCNQRNATDPGEKGLVGSHIKEVFGEVNLVGKNNVVI